MSQIMLKDVFQALIILWLVLRIYNRECAHKITIPAFNSKNSARQHLSRGTYSINKNNHYSGDLEMRLEEVNQTISRSIMRRYWVLIL